MEGTPLNESLRKMERQKDLLELLHDTALMRFNQKAFFAAKDPVKRKDYLIASKRYEKQVDALIAKLWPGENENKLTFTT